MSDSSDDRRRAGKSPNNGADAFAPARVDEAIEAARLSSPTAEDDRDAALVHALHQIHALPPGATATLERVRNQLQSAALADDDDPPMPGDLPRVVRRRPPWRPFRARFGGWQTSLVREVAAVLVVALLGASFFAALHRGGTSVRNGQPTPGVAHPSGPIGVWQDVSISQASTDGKLDFDPTAGVTYATNRDTGDVYACGSGHLWFSHDGGATYTSFMPALPAQAAPTHSARCVITTIPGFSGVFATSDAALQGGNTVPHGASPIFYAQAGDAGWQTLAIPSTARVINSTPTTALHADDIWADIFSDFAAGTGEAAIGSHNWLFARIRSSYSTSIVATPDFGHTWVWLDGPSAAFSCGNFAVDPADPHTVVCDHGNASALSETNNSGYTWQRRDAQPLRDSAVAGVHSDMLYGEQGVNGATHILRRSLATNTWQDVGGAGAVGATAQVALAPTGTLYVLLTDGGATGGHFTVEALAPDAAHFDTLLTAALPGHSQDNVRLVGLGPGGVPALYAYDVPLHSPSPGPSLARLLLPSSGIQSGGAPTATATATASPTSAGIPVLVYFSKHPESENNFSAVFSVQRTSPDQGVATFAIQQLILGPSPAEQATGLYTELTAALSGTSTCGGADFTIMLDKKGGTAEPGTATLKFCRPTPTAGIGADARIKAEIDQTLRQFSTIHKTVILTSTGHCFGDESGMDICLK